MSDKQRTSYPLRPSPELRAKLEEAARAGNRTLHSEIIARLEASFAAPPLPPAPPEEAERAHIRQVVLEEVRSLLGSSRHLQHMMNMLDDEDIDPLEMLPESHRPKLKKDKPSNG